MTSTKRALETPDKEVFYESDRPAERPDLIDPCTRARMGLHRFRLAKVVVDKKACADAAKGRSSRPLVFTMRGGSDAEFDVELYVSGDGGWHKTSGGVRLLLGGELLLRTEEGACCTIEERYDNDKVRRLVGLSESEDASALRRVWQEVLEGDWLVRVAWLARAEAIQSNDTARTACARALFRAITTAVPETRNSLDND